MAPIAATGKPRTKPDAPFPRRPLRRHWIAAALVLATAGWLAADWWRGLPDDAQASYVGRRTCIECHRQEWVKFENSHHDLAMDRATSETVLGDFSDQRLEHHGVTSRMFTRGGKYWIETEGPDGKQAQFEIKYVFGVTPLQQYMVEFDRPEGMPENEIARLQVLRVSWNTREKKWFHLDPPDVQEKLDPGDDLHWTGAAQRWNTMCADCHSTNLQRNFDDRTGVYRTTFSEIDVSCEACHGPGSLHVQLARQISPFWDRNKGYALARLKGSSHVAEIEACAPCHSRRSTLAAGYASGSNFHDFFDSETLSATSYHADGQILDEVYEYGSFVQSKMYHKQIRCSDCHDPHTSRLKFTGNEVCTNCHQHPAAKYDSVTHHNHLPNTEASRCVACHMPATTYMDVDPRRDHSLRIPRPDLSVKLGTPNACTGCHIRNTKLPPDQQPKSPTPNRPVEYADWLREAREGNAVIQRELARVDARAEGYLKQWFPRRREQPPHFAPALAAARRQAPDAQQQLIDLLKDKKQPDIARATAAAELSAFVHPGLAGDDPALAALVKSLDDRDGQVRAAAAASLDDAPEDVIVEALPPLLKDPLRLVRTRAALTLSRISPGSLRRDEPIWLKKGIEELLAGASYDNDRAGAHLLQGTVLENLGELAGAQAAYETALRLEPLNPAPKNSLARLLDQFAAREQERSQRMAAAGDRAAAGRHAQLAEAYSIRFDALKADEWSLLERDARLVPDNAPLQLQVGLARYQQGWKREAEHALETAYRLMPRNPAFGYYLAVLYKDTGRESEARQLAQRLLELRPKQPQYEQLLRDLENGGTAGGR